MSADPFEVMEWVVECEASRLQSLTDLEVLLDAQAIAEAERQRSRLDDRLEAALGQVITCALPGATWRGNLQGIGVQVITLDCEGVSVAIARSRVLRYAGLPRALRVEHEVPGRLGITWSSVLREWQCAGALRFTLIDDESLNGEVDALGADFVDLRRADGSVTTLMLTAIRCAVRNR